MPPLAYHQPSVFTDLSALDQWSIEPLPSEPRAICDVVHTLFIHPMQAEPAGFERERFADNNVRPADALLTKLLELQSEPVTIPRSMANRVVGTCRHFVVVACAFLRYRGIAARARCGFATYFHPGKAVDHWVIEYRLSASDPWVRLDPQMLGSSLSINAERLAPGQFLTGGEAWIEFRDGNIDPMTFGVEGTENWGPSEIRGNAVRDLAALNSFEMLPWDEWGRMTEAYEGKTGADYDELLDELADTCRDDDERIQVLYQHPDLIVPATLLV